MVNNISMLKSIETIYRGYRFRSRTEARWAVFFDAAGIEWKYELQGFDVNGRYYLPDFWLPRFEMFVEIKPDITACKAAEPLMHALVLASGHRGLLIADGPNIEEPPEMIHVKPTYYGGRCLAFKAAWTQCLTCNRVTIAIRGADTPLWRPQCDCQFPNVIIKHQNHSPNKDGPRIKHALEQAQWARFEHGEDGQPEPYFADNTMVRVYVAGAVLDDDGEDPVLLQWRAQIWGDAAEDNDERSRYGCAGRFQYAGPSILTSHGQTVDTLANECMSEVYGSEVLFAWIDRHEQIGTIAEIGAAYAWRRPIFIASINEELYGRFYFIQQLATVAIIAPSAVSAWWFFEQWQTP